LFIYGICDEVTSSPEYPRMIDNELDILQDTVVALSRLFPGASGD
jgi:hypothetical protein